MNAAPRLSPTHWFKNACFGMFIHFGLYSIPAGIWKGRRMARNDYAEWIRFQHDWPEAGGIPKAEYDELLGDFNPIGFSADDWVLEAKNAGMKYLIFTAKHHDGFALWDSCVSDYNVVKATAFGRDIIGELAAACRNHGLRFGLYYSHWLDWEYEGGALPPWPEWPGDPVLEQPSQAAFEGYWTKKCLPQVSELLEHYNPDLLWFDSWGEKRGDFLTEDRLARLIRLVRQARPHCLINSRIGTPQGVDYLSTGDNEFPSKGFSQPWETSGTLNHAWGHHQLDFKWKPTNQLLRNLVDNVSRAGNYQLNVGPTGEGIFPSAAIRRLKELGAWLTVNGSAIYDSRPASFAEPVWGRLTVPESDPEGTLHAFVYDPQPGATLILSGPKQPPTSARVLETGEAVAITPMDSGFAFALPDDLPDLNITAITFAW